MKAGLRGAILLIFSTFYSVAGAEEPSYWDKLSIRADAGFVHNDNITRAKSSADILSDQSYSINGSMLHPFMIGNHFRMLVSGFLGGDKFAHYNGFSQMSAGVQGELQYRHSASFFAPTIAVLGRISAEQYQSQLRDGTRYALSLSIRQPVTDRIQLFGALTHHQRDAYSKVFTTEENSARFNLDYLFGQRGTVYMGAEYRQGDLVSTGQPSLEFINISDVFAADDVFTGGLYSYRFNGTTVLTTLGYNHGLSSAQSLDFSWRRIASEADKQAIYATSAAKYIVNQLAVVYLVNF